MLVGKIRGEDGSAVRDMTSEVKDVVLEIAEEFDFPVIASMDFGHFTPNLPFPMWLKASMDAEQLVVSIDESYVV
jgi:muramoyltetrapeptide carboxypeptidase